MAGEMTSTILVIERSQAVRDGIQRVNLGRNFKLKFINWDEIDDVSDDEFVAVLADDYLLMGPGAEPPIVALKTMVSAPIVLMTSSGSPRAVAMAKESGVDGVLQKPFSAGSFRRVLSEVLAGAGKLNSDLLTEPNADGAVGASAKMETVVPSYAGQVAGDGAFDALFTELERRQPLEEGLDAFDVVERHLIRRALEATSGNQSRAARFLGITRNTLRKRIRKYGFADLLTKDDDESED